METNLEKAKRLTKDNAAIRGIDLPDTNYFYEMLELAATPDVVNKNDLLPGVSVSLPNEIDLSALANLLKYSNKYEISIQFWPDQIAVFICKGGVDLKDFGGDFEFAISSSIAYLDRITGNDR